MQTQASWQKLWMVLNAECRTSSFHKTNNFLNNILYFGFGFSPVPVLYASVVVLTMNTMHPFPTHRNAISLLVLAKVGFWLHGHFSCLGI